MENIMDRIYELLATYGLKVVGAIIIFIVGRWLANQIANLVGKAMTKAKVEPTLTNFVKNMSHIALLIFVVIAALNTLGVKTDSFVVVIGAAGLAVGFALQGTLSNFAAGVMLVIFKPFKTLSSCNLMVSTSGNSGIFSR